MEIALKVGETLWIGEHRMVVLSIRGQTAMRVALGFDGPRDIPVTPPHKPIKTPVGAVFRPYRDR